MKKICYLIAATAFVACTSTPAVEEAPVILPGDGEAVIVDRPSSAHDFSISPQSNVSDWEPTITYPKGESSGWLSRIAPKTRTLSSQTFSFRVTQWDETKPRTAYVTLTGRGATLKYKIVQSGHASKLEFKIKDEEDREISTNRDLSGLIKVYTFSDKVSQFGYAFKITPASSDVALSVRVNDACTDWVKSTVLPGSVTIRVDAANKGDVFDYSNNRKATLHVSSQDGSLHAYVVFTQEPRTAGFYTLKPGLNDPKNDGDPIEGSRIGQFILSEQPSFRVGVENVKIVNESGADITLTENDMAAIGKYFPILKSLDLSGTKVNAIPIKCFYDKKTLERVILPEGLEKIDDQAFSSCSSLQNVNIPSTVTSIGANAFSGAPLSNSVITIPRSIETIGTSAFFNNRIKRLKFEEPNDESVKNTEVGKLTISEKAFWSSIASPNSKDPQGGSLDDDLIIPNWVGEIGKNAFTGIAMHGKSIKLTIGKNVEKIGVGAFFGNKQITSIDFAEGVAITFDAGAGTTTTANTGFFGGTSLKEVIYPMSTRCPQEFVPNVLFSDMCCLETVTIKEGVKEIKRAAFTHSNILKSITLPSTLTTIEDNAFANSSTTMPASVDLSGCTALTSLGANLFFNAKGLKGTTVKLPASLVATTTGAGLFKNSGITSIDISNLTFTEFAAGMFSGCSALQSIKVSGSVTKILSGTIDGCTNGGNGMTLLFPEGLKPGDGVSAPAGVMIVGAPAGIKYGYY